MSDDICRRCNRRRLDSIHDLHSLSAVYCEFESRPAAGTPKDLLDMAVGSVLFNNSNWPRPLQRKALGADFTGLKNKIVDAVFSSMTSAPAALDTNRSALALWFHREFGDGCVHPENSRSQCEAWADQFMRSGPGGRPR